MKKALVYIRKGLTEDKIPVYGYEFRHQNCTLVVHKDYYWTVSEPTTGLSVSSSKLCATTRKQAIEDSKAFIDGACKSMDKTLIEIIDMQHARQSKREQLEREHIPASVKQAYVQGFTSSDIPF